MAPIYLHIRKKNKILWKSMSAVNCLVTNIVSSSFVFNKKLVWVWNSMRVSKWWEKKIHFWVNCPFKLIFIARNKIKLALKTAQKEKHTFIHL